MEGNDLANHVAARNVVILVPTLAILTRHRKIRNPRSEDYTLSAGMMSWMLSHAFTHSEAFEVWGFESEEVFEILTSQIERSIHRATSGYVRFESEDEARFALVNDRGIRAVYDADHARIERLWGLRGFRVPYGMHP